MYPNNYAIIQMNPTGMILRRISYKRINMIYNSTRYRTQRILILRFNIFSPDTNEHIESLNYHYFTGSATKRTTISLVENEESLSKHFLLFTTDRTTGNWIAYDLQTGEKRKSNKLFFR